MDKAQEEIAAEQRHLNRQIKEDADLMAGLIKHPGWPRFMAMIEEVAQNFNQRLMLPMENMLEATKMEFAKGALTGLSHAAQLPHAKMRQAKDLIKNTDDEE